MSKRVLARVSLIAMCSFCAVLGFGQSAAAQTPSGQARVAQVTTPGFLGTPTTTTIADTGTLADPGDIRQASQLAAAVPSILTASTVHAVTIGWPDAVASEASLADLALNIAGSTIGAGFVMSRAAVEQGSAGVGAVTIDGLSINGLPVAVTGAPNQTVLIPGGRLVINEQQTTATSAVTNALHVIVSGVADVIVGSAIARVQ
jgi:hypothetical protein